METTHVTVGNLTRLPLKDRELLLEDTSIVLFESILLKVWRVLREGERARLTELLEEGARERASEKAHEAIIVFLKERVPNVEILLRDEMHLLVGIWEGKKEAV